MLCVPTAIFGGVDIPGVDIPQSYLMQRTHLSSFGRQRFW